MTLPPTYWTDLFKYHLCGPGDPKGLPHEVENLRFDRPLSDEDFKSLCDAVAGALNDYAKELQECRDVLMLIAFSITAKFFPDKLNAPSRADV